MRKNYFLVITICVFIFLASFTVYFFLFTTPGSTFIIKSVISRYTRSGSIDIKKSGGSLSRILVFHDIEIKDSKILPPNMVKIQKLEVYFTSFNLGGLHVKIDNGRLQLPRSGLILFYGTLKNNILDANLYSKRINVEEAVGLFSESKDLKKLSGLINDIDIFVKGTFSEPKFSGECRIERLLRNGISLSNCPTLFNLQLKDVKNEPKLYGTISSNSGIISGPKTAVINLGESKISFLGEPKKTSLDLKGTSTVDGTKINIELKGTLDQPELKLASDPPLSQERLLVMLITGKSWKGTEVALGKGQLSADLVKDFVDYFVFLGSGSKIAQRLGLTGVSLTFEEEKKGVGIKKGITEKIDASYTVEQSQTKEEGAMTTQKVGGEYKITEGISIGAEKELKQESKTDQTQEQQKTDDKVILKIKKEF